MESLPKGLFIKYNENTLESVRKLFGIDKPGDMEYAVNLLEDWVKMQAHFKKTDFDRRYLENTIIVSKGSVERAKSRIDKACTLRTLMPQFFGLHDLRHFQNNELKCIEFAMMPKLTKDNKRVNILKVKDSRIDVLSACRASAYISEYLRRNDYAQTNVLVIDYVKTDAVEIIKTLATNLNNVHQLLVYLLTCCGFRLHAIYAISSSSVIEAILNVHKQTLNPKLTERLQILKDRQSLAEVFDAEILPKEYGGKEIPLSELEDQMLDDLTSEDHIEYMKEINLAVTDENKRNNTKFNEEYLGMPGSFRKLYVD